MYMPVTKRMQDYIRKAGCMTHNVYTGWEKTSTHLNTPYKLEYVKSVENDGVDEIGSVNRIAECYLTLNSIAMVVSQIRPNEKFEAGLAYKIFFMQLAIEHFVWLAKEMGLEKLTIESDMEHIEEIFIELGFEIKEISRRSYSDQTVKLEFRGIKDIK